MKKVVKVNEKRKEEVKANQDNLSSLKLQLVEKIRKEHSPKHYIRKKSAAKKDRVSVIKKQEENSIRK